MRSILPAVASVLLLSAGCAAPVPVGIISAEGPISAPTFFDHRSYSDLLSEHVDSSGLVDYAALQADSSRLNRYLVGLAGTDPRNLRPEDTLAYWINAYNAYALKIVLDSYPITEIFETGSGRPFSVRFATVGGRAYSLDDIEHRIIRVQFREPRIHFALVCAAFSCPPLRAEAYDGERIDAQLDAQARRFLHDPSRNTVTATEARLSKLFDWYEGDLGGSRPGVLAFIAPFFEGEIRAALEAAAPRLSYNDYDWSLNDQARPGL